MAAAVAAAAVAIPATTAREAQLPPVTLGQATSSPGGSATELGAGGII